mmetsp:Transcript_7942/g.25270  ORF Transcript_7942/g.25270 Transcript_7942/m.25270 type:complete len:492 (+) Transcript_7942:265-1740(+)
MMASVTATLHCRSGLTLRAVLQLLHRDGAVLHVPFLVADTLDEVRLGLDHHDAPAEGLQGLGQGLHGLHVQVVRGLVHRDEVGLRPEHGGQGEPDLLAGGEAPDLPVAAHLLVDAEGLAVPDHLAARERPLVQARGLGRDALVASDDDLVQAHGLELGDGLHGVLLGVVQALPADLVGELGAHLRAAHELLHLVAVLPVLLGQGLAALGLVLVLRLDEALLQVAVVAVLEALRDVDKGRGVEEGPQGLEVVLLHVGHAEVAVAEDLAQGALRALREAGLAAEEGHEGGLAAAVAAADGHPRAQAELRGAVPHQVVLVLGVAEPHALGLQDRLGAGLHALHGAGDGEAQLRRARDGGPHLGRRAALAPALLALLGGLLLGVEGEVAREHRVDLLLAEALPGREAAEVPGGVLELLVDVGDDVRADLVEELGLVGDDHDRGLRDGEDVVAQPLHGLLVQVVGGLVQEQDVGRARGKHGQRNARLLPTAQRPDP